MIRSEPLSFAHDGKTVVGDLYLPAHAEKPFPAVILSHGYGGNGTGLEADARFFAENGFLAYAFDFCGGGNQSRSSGTPADMSVLTEAVDLTAVLDGIRALPEVDETRVFLWGASQGGFVSSYVAASHPDKVRALVALFPAYVIPDDARRRTPDPDHLPETLDVMGMTLGRIYHRDAMSFDIYDLLPRYDGPVLLIHGTADTLVPIAYSERAVRAFPNARLIRIHGAGHGYWGADWMTATRNAVLFMRDAMAAE